MVHSTGNEKEDKLIKELRAKGITLYSYSRLGSFNTCKYGYYKTYVERDRGLSNPYSEIGTFVHEFLEGIYRGEIEDYSNFKRKLNTEMFKLEMKDLKFPNEKIENAFRSDLEHFCDNFEKQVGDFQLEKAYVAKFGNHYLMGYIDVIREYNDKTEVIDFKTSSKFASKKLEEAGRQLLIYKLALEQSGLNIDSVMWNMLKYCYVCWTQKNKKIKKKMINRSKLIKEMRNAFESTMLNEGMNQLEVDLLLGEVEKDNDFNKLPQCIKDVFWIEDCLLEYEVTDSRIEEVEKYIEETINEIESMDKEDISQWEPLNIDKDNFYCNTLCNHRATCPHLAKWKKDNPFKKIGF